LDDFDLIPLIFVVQGYSTWA